jgi:hypothetical protein
MKLPPGLYRDELYFYYQVSNTEYSWYDFSFSQRGWRQTGCIAWAHLRPSSPLEFVLLTGKAFDPTELDEEHARRVAQRATRRRERKGADDG